MTKIICLADTCYYNKNLTCSNKELRIRFEGNPIPSCVSYIEKPERYIFND